MGQYSESGAELPMNALFRELRSRWINKSPKERSAASLARMLDVKPQRISQWATGTDPSRGAPPWPVILLLADDLNVEIRINADEVSLVRRRRVGVTSHKAVIS